MPIEQLANDAATTLAAGIAETDTTLVVSSRVGFPDRAVFRIRVDDELILVTGGASTDSWTVQRGIEGTTPASHGNGAEVTHVLTAGSLRAVVDDGQSRWVCDGRLTLVSGTAVPTEDAQSSTLRFTPFMGNRLALRWNGNWSVQSFAELSLSRETTLTATRTSGTPTLTSLAGTHTLAVGMKVTGSGLPAEVVIESIDGANQVTLSAPALSSGSGDITFALPDSCNIDLFIEAVDAEQARLRFGSVWTNATTRAAEMHQVDGVGVYSLSQPWRWVGTVRTDETGLFVDESGRRFVWNLHHPRPRALVRTFGDGSTFWNYSATPWTSANSDDSMRVQWVCGADGNWIDAQGLLLGQGSTVISASVGLGLDSTNNNDAQLHGTQFDSNAWRPAWATYRGQSGTGHHFIQLLHRADSAGTMTWCGCFAITGGVVWRGGIQGSILT